MTIEEKTGKTLAALGVTDAPGIHALFAEVRAAMEAECRRIFQEETDVNDAEFDLKVTNLHNRWLARNNGLIQHHIKKNWLQPAAKDLIHFVGSDFNDLKSAAIQEIDHNIPAKRQRTSKALAQFKAPLESETAPDLTLPGYRRPLGSLHPVTQVQREIEDIFLGLGFSIETGPEIESVYYNFDALNIPESHPSRDDWDTIYIDSKTVLRTHTSPVQIRAMELYVREKRTDGLYIIIPGKCYRNDNPDATHSPMFHQCEGLAVDRDITFADLKGTLDFFAKKFFGEKVRTSFRPSFFPFTEPSGEVAVSCHVCDGAGCRTCKDSGWIEVMGCGMVHPQVLRNGGLDPDVYSGWAFGLGIDRFAMIKYDIHDIQLFFQGDVRFLEQF